MMSTEAYIEWVSLFNKETENAWMCEIKELRKAAMILYALKEEFNNIQTEASNRIATFRNIFIQDDKMSSEQTSTEEIFSRTSSKHKTSSLHLKTIHLNGASELTSDKSDLQRSDTILLGSDSDQCTGKGDLSPTICTSRGRLFKRNKTLKFSDTSLLDISKTSDNTDVVMDEADLGNMDLIDTTIIESTPEKSSHLSKRKKVKMVREKFKKRLVFNDQCNPPDMTSSLSTLKPDVVINKPTERSDVEFPHQSTNKAQNEALDETFIDENDIQAHNIMDNVIKGNKKNEPQRKALPKPIIYETGPVRGMQRMNLQGWDCEECSKFYYHLGPAEAKKMINKCSKHRSKFKPDDDYTPEGFWKMSFSQTQIVNDGTQKSMVYDF